MSYKLAGVIWNDDGTMATKELTPLEALKNIEKEVEDYEGFDESTWYQMDRTRFKIIETALKQAQKDKEELEELKNAISNGTIQNQWANMNSKNVKVLEIIEEKGLDIREFRYASSLYEYNICKNIGCKDLTQEEYNLLKEVL